jgi:hypothetical protein
VLDQDGAHAEPAGGRRDQQDAQPRLVRLVATHQEDASRALAVDLGDPAGLAQRIVLGDVLGDDLRDELLEVRVPAELLCVGLAVGPHDPAEVTGLVHPADLHPWVP